MTFKPHIDRILVGCNQRLFSLTKMSSYIHPWVALIIYKSLIMSRLNYGNILCLGALSSLLSRLQKTQNRALCICHCANRNTSNINLHVKSKVLTLFLSRKLEVYKCMYKRWLTGYYAQTAPEERPQTRYALSRPPDFDVPKTERFLRSVIYQCPKLWAELPNYVKNLMTV